MLTATGAIAGVVRGLPCLLGVGAGMAVMMFAAALGLGSLVLAYPALLHVFQWVGAAYLLWLAWKIARAPIAAGEQVARPVGFVEAFLFQWLNPKSWLVSTGAAATFFQIDAAAIAGMFFAVALACGFVWLAFGVAARRLLASARAQRAFNLAMGAALAASVLLTVA